MLGKVIFTPQPLQVRAYIYVSKWFPISTWMYLLSSQLCLWKPSSHISQATVSHELVLWTRTDWGKHICQLLLPLGTDCHGDKGQVRGLTRLCCDKWGMVGELWGWNPLSRLVVEAEADTADCWCSKSGVLDVLTETQPWQVSSQTQGQVLPAGRWNRGGFLPNGETQQPGKLLSFWPKATVFSSDTSMGRGNTAPKAIC